MLNFIEITNGLFDALMYFCYSKEASFIIPSFFKVFFLSELTTDRKAAISFSITVASFSIPLNCLSTNLTTILIRLNPLLLLFKEHSSICSQSVGDVIVTKNICW